MSQQDSILVRALRDPVVRQHLKQAAAEQLAIARSRFATMEQQVMNAEADIMEAQKARQTAEFNLSSAQAERIHWARRIEQLEEFLAPDREGGTP